MRCPLLCGVLLLVASLTAASSEVTLRASAPPQLASVQAFIEAGIDAGLAPSVAVVIIEHDRTVWADAFGYADPSERRPATIDTPYLLASVSKPLTATGLMVLVDRGLVDLDAPASRYLPSPLHAFAGDTDAMTVRRVGSHTAGLPPHVNFFVTGRPPAWTETIARYGFAFYEPGSRWEYSNLGFGLLGLITERMAGACWECFLHDQVFAPAGMSHTFIRLTPGRARLAARPRRTDVAGRSVALPSYGFDHPGASAIWSSASDLARFLRLHLHDGILDGRQVISAASARAMRQPRGRDDMSGSPYGFGWRLDYIPGVEVFGHNGNMPGVSTLIRAFPVRQVAYVVLSNGENETFVRDIDRKLAEALLHFTVPVRGVPPPPAFALRDVAGEWVGRIAIDGHDLLVQLRIGVDGTADIALGGSGRRAIDGLRVSDGALTGTFAGYMPIRPDVLGGVAQRLRLWRTGNRLQGLCITEKDDEFELSAWVELRR